MVLNFILFLGLTLHNARYLSSLYLPLIFLILLGINNLETRFKLQNKILIVVSLISLGIHLFYLYKLEPTRYFSLFSYLKNQTNNFTSKERVYAYGSVRSLNWYRDGVRDPNLFIVRRDYKIMCPEFYTFSTFVFDKEEMQKINFTGKALYDYVKSKEQSFRQIYDLNDFIIYQRVFK